MTTSFNNFLDKNLPTKLIDFIDEKYGKTDDIDRLIELMESISYDYNVYEEVDQKITHWDVDINFKLKKKRNKKKKKNKL